MKRVHEQSDTTRAYNLSDDYRKSTRSRSNSPGRKRDVGSTIGERRKSKMTTIIASANVVTERAIMRANAKTELDLRRNMVVTTIRKVV